MTADFSKLGVLLGRLARGRGRPEELSPALGSIVGIAADGGEVAWPVPSQEHASHVVVLASSGSGKTVMVANALVHEVAALEQGLALLVVDPKGDLVQAVLHGLAAVASERLSDVRLLDPFSASGFPFNLNHLALGQTPQDIRAAQLAGLVAEVSTATGAQKHLGVGARQLDVLGNVILGALAADHPEATVLWALEALTAPRGLKLLASQTTSARAKAFLTTARLSDELRASCASRLRTAFAASDSLERLVAAPSCIQFHDLLAPGRITLVDLGRPVGGLVALQSFYANLIVRLAIEHLLERPSPWTGHHVRLVVDEAQVVAPVLSDRAEAVLTVGRSRGLSLTAVSQGTTLIKKASDTLLRVLLGNSPTKFVGRLAAADAELLSHEQAPVQGVDETLAATRARFVASATNLPDREFFELAPGRRRRFRSQEVDMAAWDQASHEHHDDIEEARKRLALPEETMNRVALADARGLRTKTTPERAPREPRSRWG